MPNPPSPARSGDAAALVEAGHRQVREKQWDAAVALFRRALAIDPRLGVAYGSLGYCFEQLGQAGEAISAYTAAAALVPDNPEIPFNLGNVFRSQARPEEAAASFRRALTIDPRHSRALNNLGTVLQMMGRTDEAIAAYRQALAAKPDYAEALNNLGGAQMTRNEVPAAIESYRAALRLDPGLDRARFNEGIARLLIGDLPAGWDGYEYRQPPSGRPLPLGARWNGRTDLAGKTILLNCEQGLGDSIQFVRYAQLLRARGSRVILEVQPALRRVFASLAGVDEIIAVGQRRPPHDLYCPLMSLPHCLGTTLEAIPWDGPYLQAPPEGADAPPSPAAGRRPRIGFAWAGNPAHRHDRWRSIPVAQMLGLFDGGDAEAVSLQKDRSPADAAVLAARPDATDLAVQLGDFADTAAVVAHLDLVVTVDSAVAHLAGAMGKPVWILLPFAPDWRWLLERSDSPWYPSARLYRQPSPGDWSAVLAHVRQDLSSYRLT